VVLGPLPANASAEGPLRKPNIEAPGILRQPVETNVTAVVAVNKANERVAFLFSILPTLYRLLTGQLSAVSKLFLFVVTNPFRFVTIEPR